MLRNIVEHICGTTGTSGTTGTTLDETCENVLITLFTPQGNIETVIIFKLILILFS